MPDISQIERQWHILSMLAESRRGLTIDEILSRLHFMGVDISRKTAERDVDSITHNFFVYEEMKDGRTYYLAKKYNAQDITFSISELLSLHFTRKVMNSYDSLDVGVTASRIIERIISSMPQINKIYLRNLESLLKVNVTGINPESDLNPDYLDILKQAIEETRCVQLEYYAFNTDQTTKRCFEPYFLEIYEGCWHVVGKCRLRNSVRDFRVSRIRMLQLTEERFVKPESFFETYNKNRFEKLSGDIKVRMELLFNGQAARMVEEYEFNKADKLQWVEEGLLFERTAALTPEIIKWVLGFGSEVKVLEPVDLRDAVVEEINKMGEIYR